MAVPPSPNAFHRYIWPLFLRDRWLLLGALLLNGIHGAAIALQNVYPKWLFSQVLEPPGLSIAQRWTQLAWLVGGYLLVSLIVRMAAWHAGYRMFTWVRERVVFALRGQFFRHVNHLCLRFHGEHPSGELFSYLFGTPLSNVMGFFQHTSMSVPGAIITILTTLAMFWKWDWAVASILMTTSFASVALMIRAREKMQKISSDFQSAEGDVSGRVADLLRGNKAVKLYAMEEQVATDFDRQALVIGKKSYERDVLSHIEYMKQEGFGYLCYAALLAACTWRYLAGHIDLGTVAACLASFAGLNWPMQTIFQAFSLWGGAEASINRIGTVLDTPSTTPDPEHDVAAAVPTMGEIVFDRVSFAYVPGQPVLRDLSLVIPRGQRIALVGPSGAGKSTLAQLILRLYDPQSGVVRLGGVDVRKFEASDLRKEFGVVPQDPFIFRTTMRDNVRVARPDASDDAIRRACTLANAWEFIARLPGGLDARVGEGGSSLSGGQRQRLAIARALLAEPQCFIFDEATSALDTLSEQLIQHALDKNLGGRTVLFIAHRLATVKNCDRILVIADGRIAQDGTYSDLAGRPGLFQDLVHGQSLRE
jgi:ATP-binding cassette subfamily B protein/subfamily B ATP-binding cassette protein MsbA